MAMALRPEEQKRLMVRPPTLTGSPARMAATRAMLCPWAPCGCPQPRMTSSTSLGSSCGTLPSASLMQWAARSDGSVMLNEPRCDFASGVRELATTTASLMAVPFVRASVASDSNTARADGGHWHHRCGRLAHAPAHLRPRVARSGGCIVDACRLQRCDAVGVTALVGAPRVDRHAGQGDRRADARHAGPAGAEPGRRRSEEHTSELQSLAYLVCRLLLEKKKKRTSQQRDQIIGLHKTLHTMSSITLLAASDPRIA